MARGRAEKGGGGWICTESMGRTPCESMVSRNIRPDSVKMISFVETERRRQILSKDPAFSGYSMECVEISKDQNLASNPILKRVSVNCISIQCIVYLINAKIPSLEMFLIQKFKEHNSRDL